MKAGLVSAEIPKSLTKLHTQIKTLDLRPLNTQMQSMKIKKIEHMNTKRNAYVSFEFELLNAYKRILEVIKHIRNSNTAPKNHRSPRNLGVKGGDGD